MLQRIQSIWLLLAAACSFLTLKFSFFSGQAASGLSVEYLTATTHIPLLIMTVVQFSAALVAIFLYKNRKLQFRITLVDLVISISLLVFFIREAMKFTTGTYSLTSLLYLAVPVCLFLAARGIRKDDKLVKSLDRLR